MGGFDNVHMATLVSACKDTSDSTDIQTIHNVWFCRAETSNHLPYSVLYFRRVVICPSCMDNYSTTGPLWIRVDIYPHPP